MLAKNMKIQTLMRQRYFIEKMIKASCKENKDGNGIYVYKGIVYPENINYFTDEGFAIRVLDSERIIIEYGAPYYIFYPKAEIELSEDEIQLSKEVIEPKNVNIIDEFFEDFLKKEYGN